MSSHEYDNERERERELWGRGGCDKGSEVMVGKSYLYVLCSYAKMSKSTFN